MAKFCHKCGRELKAGNKFCPGCGTPVPSVPKTGQENSSGAGEWREGAVPLAPVQAASPLDQKKLIRIGVIAAVVVVLLIVTGVKLFGGGYKTPFKNWEKGVNKADARAIKEVFVPEYTDEYIDLYDDDDKLEEMLKEQYEDYSVSFDILEKEDVDEDKITKKLDKYASRWEKYIEEEDISACCLVDVELTGDRDGDEKTHTWKNVPVVKIDGDWYIVPGGGWLFGF